MDIPFGATLPLFAVGGFTLLLSIIFCCYLAWLRRQGERERGYREVRYRRTKKKSNEACAVCLDDFKGGQKLAMCYCKHAFHRKCLLQWLVHHNSCPLCKQQVHHEPGESTSLVRGGPTSTDV